MKEQISVPVTLMRGGTSKAVFLARRDVPSDPQALQRFLLALFGSPDVRQIDGLGGADILTSKCAIIGPPSRPDADIDYTFVQIGIDQPSVSFEIVCGNISSATGVYALQERLIPVQEPATTVRVHNTNTGKILRMVVQCAHGEPRVEGDSEVDGVPAKGAEVALDYSGTSGATTGRLLPTGQARDSVYVSKLGREIPVSIVDVGTACVFIRAADLGVTGTELPGQLSSDIYEMAEEVRRWAADRCNLPASGTLTPTRSSLRQRRITEPSAAIESSSRRRSTSWRAWFSMAARCTRLFQAVARSAFPWQHRSQERSRLRREAVMPVPRASESAIRAV